MPRRPPPPRQFHWFDAAPILDRFDARGGFYQLLGERHRDTTDREAKRLAAAYRRAAKHGQLTMGQADFLCVKMLGVNPALIYGAAWWDDPPTEDLGEAS